MLYRLFAFFFCFLINIAVAQDQKRLLYYEQKVNQASNDADKVFALGELAEYYSVFKLESKADSVLQKALFIAEISSDKDLVLKILFNNNVANLKAWSSKETFEKSSNYVQKGLRYAQELNRSDYIALAYIRLAGIYRKRSLYNEAIQQATQAFTALGNSKADSLRCVLYNELGDIYIAKTDAVNAYKNYNNAFDLAYKIKNGQLQSSIYHRFFELYRYFGDDESGKKYLLLSLQLNNKNHYKDGLYKDYIDLARITNERDYIDKASELAVELNSDRYKLSAKRLLFYWFMVEGKNSTQTFNYLISNSDLLQFIQNQGLANYNWEIGNIYRYSAQYDSALYYYKIAEKEYSSTIDNGIKLEICNAMAETYLQNKDSADAYEYYLRSFDLCKQVKQLSYMPVICSQLGILNAKRSDFGLAYYYTIQADSANKLLQSNAAKDKVVLLQVDRENKKRENDLMEANHEEERKHNLQIMAMILMITGIFTFMLFLGMFAVSKATIRALGYFAFICLFEFIIVLIDHPIIAFTNGEPLKIWGIKIVVIALIIPIHHFMEHRLINYLQSRKLLEARQRFSLTKWWQRIKKPAPVKNTDVQEDITLL